MADLTPRPRSVTELVDATFQFYRRAPLQFILASAICYAPFVVMTLVIGANPDPLSATFFASSILSILAYLVMNAANTLLTAELYAGREPDAMTAIGLVLRRFFSVLATSFIQMVLIFVGFFLLIVGAVYMYARTALIIPALMIEDVDPLESFRRSSWLTVGHKWRILGAMLLFFLIYIVVLIPVGMLIAFLGEGVLGTFITTVVTILVSPIGGILTALLYYDARIRREGYDLEMMAGGSSAPTEPVTV